MAKRRKRSKLIGMLFGVVIILVIGTYLIKLGPLARKAVGSADTTAVTDTSSDAQSAKAVNAKEKGEKDKKEEVDPVPVEVAAAGPRRISSYYLTTAALEPEKKVSILAKIAGEVRTLHVEEGAVVEEGALLCNLDDKEQRVALEEARINRDKQRREYERIRGMHERGLISDKEYSDVKYQYEIAENQYEAARLTYEYTKIRAPFSGVIVARHVDRGENVGIGTELFEIADADPLLLRMYLPENEIASIRIGQEVFITPDSDPDATMTGKITLISPQVDERTGTVKVTAETKGQAMPGSFVRVRIVTDVHEETLSVPRRGVVSDAGEMYLFVAEADTVRKAEVSVGFQDEEYAEILNGIESGDTIVVVGTGGLRTGTKIRILNGVQADSLMQSASADS